MRASNFRLPDPRTDHFPFAGGLDEVSPSNYVPAGFLRESQNVQIDINGGYTTPKGYERFDGQAAPSAAVYYRLNVTITGTFTVGDTVTQLVSGATGYVVSVVTDVGDDDYLVLTKVTGTFDATNDLQVAAATQGTASSLAVASGASTGKLNGQYKNAAADVYRDDIAAVPGDGDILGIEVLSDVLYAWRANAAGTAVEIWKSSGSGWTKAVATAATDTQGFSLAFTSGSTEINEGDVIDALIDPGGGKGQATITRVMLTSGSWDGGDAAGTLIFPTQTNTFAAGGIEVAGSGDIATIAGDSSAITLSVGGRYETIIQNFGGATGSKRIYGCDKVNKGFEFDGSVYCPIATGMATDTPKHVAAFRDHLFFSFGASAQHSGIGAPYIWTVVSGAGELSVSEDITAFKVLPGGTGDASMGIFAQNQVHVLYGTSALDWNLVRYREEVGAYPYTIQEFGMTLMLDDRGVVELHTAQEFGNFDHNIISRLVQPWVNERKGTVAATCISRDKSQYRLFYTDKYALFITTNNRQILGLMPQLYTHKVTCITSREDSNGNEVIYFGSEDGWVFQDEKGTSHDGGPIEVFFYSHYWHSRSPRVEKAYRDASFEVSGTGYAEFSVDYNLSYSNTAVPQPGAALTQVGDFSAVRWDTFTWDSFFWDGVTLQPNAVDLEGYGENISLVVTSSSDYFAPIVFNGVLLHYTARKQLRTGN